MPFSAFDALKNHKQKFGQRDVESWRSSDILWVRLVERTQLGKLAALLCVSAFGDEAKVDGTDDEYVKANGKIIKCFASVNNSEQFKVNIKEGEFSKFTHIFLVRFSPDKVHTFLVPREKIQHADSGQYQIGKYCNEDNKYPL